MGYLPTERTVVDPWFVWIAGYRPCLTVSTTIAVQLKAWYHLLL